MDMYWITRFDYIRTVAVVAVLLGIIPTVIGLCSYFECEKDGGRFVRLGKYGLLVILVAVAIFVFVPSGEEMAATVVFPKVMASHPVDDGGEVVKKAVEWARSVNDRGK